jgi:hypothetical protein
VLDAQVRLQAEVATGAKLDECADAERAVILGGPYPPPAPERWDAPVPLVLVTAFYRPAGELARPQGPPELQIWLDPADDLALLTSLHRAGVIWLGARDQS